MFNEIVWVQSIQQLVVEASLESLAIFFARWLIIFLGGVVITFAFFAKGHLRHQAREGLWTLLLALLLSLVLGELFGRARPFTVLSDVFLLVSTPLSSGSFPSSHATAAFALILPLAWHRSWKPLLWFIPAILVALGRVMVGVHYPSDVLAGVCVAFISYLIVRWLHHVLRERWIRFAV